MKASTNLVHHPPEGEKQFRRPQRLGGWSRRLDETYVRMKGNWASLYRAVDKEGQAMDFLLPPQRDRDAAETSFHKAMRNPRLPEKLTIDQSGRHTAAIKRSQRIHKTGIAIQQCKYLNDIVEQDRRAVTRQGKPM